MLKPIATPGLPPKFNASGSSSEKDDAKAKKNPKKEDKAEKEPKTKKEPTEKKDGRKEKKKKEYTQDGSASPGQPLGKKDDEDKDDQDGIDSDEVKKRPASRGGLQTLVVTTSFWFVCTTECSKFACSMSTGTKRPAATAVKARAQKKPKGSSGGGKKPAEETDEGKEHEQVEKTDVKAGSGIWYC